MAVGARFNLGAARNAGSAATAPVSASSAGGAADPRFPVGGIRAEAVGMIDVLADADADADVALVAQLCRRFLRDR